MTRYYGGRVLEVDEECSIIADLDVGSWTCKMIYDEARRFLYVGENHPGGNGAPGSVQVVDTWNCEVVASIDLHGQGGILAKAPRDRFVYVISTMAGDTKLYKIDTADWSNAGVLDLPTVSTDVLLSRLFRGAWPGVVA